MAFTVTYNIYRSGSALKPLQQSFTSLFYTVVYLVLCLEGKELPLPRCLPKFSVAVLPPVSCLLLPALKSPSSGSHTYHVITLAHSVGSFLLHRGRGQTSSSPIPSLYVLYTGQRGGELAHSPTLNRLCMDPMTAFPFLILQKKWRPIRC